MQSKSLKLQQQRSRMENLEHQLRQLSEENAQLRADQVNDGELIDEVQSELALVKERLIEDVQAHFGKRKKAEEEVVAWKQSYERQEQRHMGDSERLRLETQRWREAFKQIEEENIKLKKQLAGLQPKQFLGNDPTKPPSVPTKRFKHLEMD